jgi:hypothetical protein
METSSSVPSEVEEIFGLSKPAVSRQCSVLELDHSSLMAKRSLQLLAALPWANLQLFKMQLRNSS